MAAAGAGELLLTSMDRDGTKSGFDLELTRRVADAVKVPVIASGGVGKLDDLVDGVTGGHASAVLAASIFHFGIFTIAEAKARLAAAGIPVRPASRACGIETRGGMMAASEALDRLYEAILDRRGADPGIVLYGETICAWPGEDCPEAG